jgi:hypothetical protein
MIRPNKRSILLDQLNDVFAVPSSMHIKLREKDPDRFFHDRTLKTTSTLPIIKPVTAVAKHLTVQGTSPTSLPAMHYLQVPSLTFRNPDSSSNLDDSKSEVDSREVLTKPFDSFLRTSVIPYSRSCPLKTANHRMLMSPKAVRFRYDDKYVFDNWVRHYDTTPFNKLVHMARDSNLAVFPYLAKVMREVRKVKTVSVQKRVNKPKAYFECSCTAGATRTHYKQMPGEEDLKSFCGEVREIETFFDNPPPFNLFIVVCFEGVIGCVADGKLKLRRGAIKFLQSIDSFYSIILLIQTSSLFPTVSAILSAKKIHILKVYTVAENSSKELAHLEQIYKDFHIKEPSLNVLVMASLNLDLQKGEVIFPSTKRVSQKLNVSLCPVSSSSPPITFLVPHLFINPSAKPFEALLQSFRLSESPLKFSFQDWAKACRAKFKVVRTTLPYEIVMDSMPRQLLGKKCKLHNSVVGYKPEIPANCFILMID